MKAISMQADAQKVLEAKRGGANGGRRRLRRAVAGGKTVQRKAGRWWQVGRLYIHLKMIPRSAPAL